MNIPFLERQLTSHRSTDFEEDHLAKIITKPKREKSRPQRQLTRTFFVRLEKFEIEGLANAESEQCKVDRFWGLDKAAIDQQREVEGVRQEELRSRRYHEICQRQLRQQATRREQLTKQKEAEEQQTQLEYRMRADYFRFLHSASSSDEIIHYAWPTKQRVVGCVAAKQNGASKLPQRQAKSPQVAVHQAPRAASAAIEKDVDPSRAPSRGSGAALPERTTPTMSRLRGRTRRHVAIGIPLTGHPIFHWDQPAAIRSVLQEFEQEDGTIGNTAGVIQKLKADVGTRLALRFTLLGSLMKSQQWENVEVLFKMAASYCADDEEADDGLAEEERTQMQMRITVDDVAHALRDLACVNDVPVRWIQLAPASATVLHRKQRGGTTTADEQGAIARYLTAEVDGGQLPLVFALFRRGAQLLPARVESVGREGNLFNLRYLLSPEDDEQLAQFVQRHCQTPASQLVKRTFGSPTALHGGAQVDALRRQGDEDGRAAAAVANREVNQHHQMLREAKTEEDVLRVMFHVADTERSGLARPLVLLKMLDMPTWRRTVATLDSLRTLSGEEHARQALLSMTWTSGCDRISLIEWIEFCLALKDYTPSSR